MQVPAPIEYARATSVEDAVDLLERLGEEARVIAGGHSLLPMMKLRLAAPEYLVDINDLHDLAYIREEDGDIRVGALTRHPPPPPPTPRRGGRRPRRRRPPPPRPRASTPRVGGAPADRDRRRARH